MDIFIREKTLDEIKTKLNSIASEFSKINYLESAVSKDFTFDIKRFIYTHLAEMYEAKKMYEKAAKAIVKRTVMEITFRERIASFTKAGELYAKAGRVEDSVHIFVKALADANSKERQEIKSKVKRIFLECARKADNSGKKANALAYYEKLLELPLDLQERQEVKSRLLVLYQALGKFREARALEGRE